MASSKGALGLMVVSLVGVVVAAAWYGQEVWQDSGGFALVLFGVPVLCPAAALWAERSSGTKVAPVLIAVLGVVSLGWSLITAGGLGLLFLVPSFLLLIAAAISWSDRGGSPSRPVRM